MTESNTIDPELVERAARILDAHPDYRVLRRLPPAAAYGEPIADAERLVGMIVDLETTSAEPETAKVIEVGTVTFEFAADGRIGRVLDVYGALNDPGEPLTPEITEITGITDDMVKGQAIDRAHIVGLSRGADLVIAHNADFDRPIGERHWPEFVGPSWACSHKDVPWAKLGVRGQKLDYLLMAAGGAFHDAHRAADDCRALLHILAQIGQDGRSYFEHLLHAARSPMYRVWALESPFETKDMLKARGYRWSDGKHGRPKSWYRDVHSKDDMNAELRWIMEAPGLRWCAPWVVQINSRDRYSVRSFDLRKGDRRATRDAGLYDEPSGQGL